MDEKKDAPTKREIQSDLFFIFGELYKRGLITREELDKCNQKVMERKIW